LEQFDLIIIGAGSASLRKQLLRKNLPELIVFQLQCQFNFAIAIKKYNMLLPIFSREYFFFFLWVKPTSLIFICKRELF